MVASAVEFGAAIHVSTHHRWLHMYQTSPKKAASLIIQISRNTTSRLPWNPSGHPFSVVIQVVLLENGWFKWI